VENLKILPGAKRNYEPIIAGIASKQCATLKNVDFSQNKVELNVF
jgi:hypothetical protein